MCVALLALVASGRVGAEPAPDLGAVLRGLARQHRICAVALAVVSERRLVGVERAGACASSSQPDPDAVFQAASLGKPLFAYGVLQLVKQGRMDLDAPVMRYLPNGYVHRHAPLAAQPSELVNDARLQAVTVRMLLNHTSGLPNWSSGPLRFDAQPGERWQYSGEGYVLLQRAVEAVTGLPLDAFMREQVFAPLGMQSSDYVTNAELAARLVAGTKANGAPRKTFSLATPVAAFSLYTTARDYARFLAALLQDDATLARIIDAPVAADAKLDLAWGLGWGVERGPDELFLWQWGNNPGYRAFVLASPRSGRGFVMLTNSENGLALAAPLTKAIMGSEPRLLRSPLLDSGIETVLCNKLGLCL